MQAYKLKRKIDSEGNLVIPQPTNLNPGEVEVIILQSDCNSEFTDDEYQLLGEAILKLIS